ncbi:MULTISPECIES: peptide-methionine (S)-S-oxide reductase MsrA [unclassified Limnobacter]|jgi:peptide-methionine (S)-S-oxide reductase|uniref:peptide-methionine (S)-S-oxide reductase MsrA n=1 Tax=unclassified Limnobacter TaxID=2630203 RepID=UPI000C3CC067|nr:MULTISPECIES: peptide-methionine (S)-S-oxide reductase MsrA [unclassified Limnobacter]MAZ10243.1 peptide-methionine (S)-S-oxide reductase [Sutterellaceae bacterium]|tara:strand:+ start:11399 stop:12007 length:609 start_codon:yes stop_codon:yes gene_type:complete
MAWVVWSRNTATLLLGISGLLPQAHAQKLEQAIFAGGCFWCMEEVFEKIRGVKSVESGYTGGRTSSPTYEQVSQGNTGHVEVVRVQYDPQQISYGNLLKAFWTNIDPTVENRQFCDVGEQYRSAIFYLNEQQHREAKQSKEQLLGTGKFKTVYTTVEAAHTFYVAEEYHQDFYRKNPLRYRYYKTTCGRENRLNEVWGYTPK